MWYYLVVLWCEVWEIFSFLMWCDQLKVKVAQLCLTLHGSMNCSLPGSPPIGGKSAGLGCQFLLQEVFPTQGSFAGRLFTIRATWQSRHLPQIQQVINGKAFKSHSYLNCAFNEWVMTRKVCLPFLFPTVLFLYSLSVFHYSVTLASRTSV